METVSKLSIFMTVGVLFCPLAIVVTLAFVVDSLVNQLMIGRFLHRIDEDVMRAAYRDIIAKEVRGSSMSLGNAMLKLIVPFAALFYGFFLFDTYGDSAGYRAALWCTIVMASTPLLLWCGYLVSVRLPLKRCVGSTGTADTHSIELSVSDESNTVKRLQQSITLSTGHNATKNPMIR